MAHTLQLSDGTNTLDLAIASGNGIGLKSFIPPGQKRVYSRTTAFPAIDGQQTIGSALDDSQAELILYLFDTSPDNIDALLRSIKRYTELARMYEEGSGVSPVWLQFKRQGETNTSYWRVINLVALDIVGSERWLDVDTLTNVLLLRVVLTLEPTAHAQAPTTVINGYTLTNVRGSNYRTTGTLGGDSPGDMVLRVQKTGASVVNWTTVWLAQLADTPDYLDYTGLPDASAAGGQFARFTLGPGATGTPGLISSYSSQKYANPTRAFLRIRYSKSVSTGVPTDLKLQLRARIGTSVTSATTYAPTVTYSGSTDPFAADAWYLVDLGSVTMSTAFKRVAASTANVTYDWIISNTGTGTLQVDVNYLELLPLWGFTQITGANISSTKRVAYEMTNKTVDGATYHWPRRNHVTYQYTNTGQLELPLSRAGRLSRITGNQAPYIWVAPQGSNEHNITEGISLTAEYLPGYELGLRGAS